MSATTIKLETPLLEELKSIKSPKASLSAFVREVLEREIRKHHRAEAAETYLEFLKKHPKEATDLEAWEKAPLHTDPRKKRS